MTEVSFRDAQERLRWARQHYESISDEIATFEEAHRYSIRCTVDKDSGEYSFHVFGLEEPPSDWGLVIADCLHNARVALDYIAVGLLSLSTGADPAEIDNIGFPIVTDHKDLSGVMKRLATKGMADGYLTRLKELQPVKVGDPSIWGMGAHWPVMSTMPSQLHRLASLDNFNKHRLIRAAWHGVAWYAADKIAAPDGFNSLSASTAGDALHEGAQVGSITYSTPLPDEGWRPTEVQMKRHFPLSVSVGEFNTTNAVREVVPLCLWGVECVLAVFAPALLHRQPPLPVTATNDMPGPDPAPPGHR